MKPATPHQPSEPAPARTVEGLTAALSAPFEPREIKFKPAVVSGNRALALAYVDARVIQDRLDEVLGVDGWQDEYECLPDGSVVCRLRLRLGDEWVTKMDVGGPSEQPDGGDRMKAAFSDALKRAAVKFGVSRYLYRLPSVWVDYDTQKRQLVRPPALPDWALPAAAKKGKEKEKGGVPQPAPEKQKTPTRPAPRPGVQTLPVNGTELQRRLQAYDAQLAAKGLIEAGDLMKHVAETGAKAGHGHDMTKWGGAAIVLAVDATKAFEAEARQRPRQRKEVA